MIEMKIRVDDEVDLAGISVNRSEPRAGFFPRLKADTEKPGEPRAKSSSGVVLAIRVQPGIEQHPSLRMLDQKDRDRHSDVSLSAIHSRGELAGQRAASESIEVDHHLPESVTGS
jgi:hypothetical protein